MFELLKLPNELIHEVLQQVDSAEDILNISLTNKRLHDLSEPYLLQRVTIVIYTYSSESNVASGFAKLTEQQILRLQHIDCLESIEVFNQKANRLYLKIPLLSRYSREENPKAKNANSMRSHLRELLLRMKSGQLRSIRYILSLYCSLSPGPQSTKRSANDT
ncbi:hypothetical protein TWF281_004339 [Arthrobotrys megalospora]